MKIKNLTNKIRFSLTWSNFEPIIDGWIPKFSLFVPIIGYYILFNDNVIEFFEMTTLTGEQPKEAESWRIYLIYYGLFFLGISNIIFRIFRPEFLKLGKAKFSYAENGLNKFSFRELKQKYDLFNEKYGPGDNREFEPSWNKFCEDFKRTFNQSTSDNDSKNWKEIISSNEEGLKDLLMNYFEYRNKKKLIPLKICIFISATGYTCLAVASTVTFYDVTKSFLVKIF